MATEVIVMTEEQKNALVKSLTDIAAFLGNLQKLPVTQPESTEEDKKEVETK